MKTNVRIKLFSGFSSRIENLENEVNDWLKLGSITHVEIDTQYNQGVVVITIKYQK